MSSFAPDAGTDASAPGGLAAWRRQTRDRLIEGRIQAGGRRRAEWNRRIEPVVRELIGDPGGRRIGFYWPFRGEFDARALVAALIEGGAVAALPAVVAPRTPLEFRFWEPGTETEPGAYKIPVPRARHLVTPDLLLVPLVGFDAGRYRLGYGAGYYDRTLAAARPRPFAIGIGYELSRLDTIHPQPHDIPMDVIVTEEGVAALRI